MVYFSSLCKRNMRNIKHFQVLTCSFLCKQCFTLEAISSSWITSCLVSRWPSGSEAFHIQPTTHSSHPTDAFVLHFLPTEDTDVSATAPWECGKVVLQFLEAAVFWMSTAWRLLTQTRRRIWLYCLSGTYRQLQRGWRLSLHKGQWVQVALGEYQSQVRILLIFFLPWEKSVTGKNLPGTG